jgi:hypothetical protein
MGYKEKSAWAGECSTHKRGYSTAKPIKKGPFGSRVGQDGAASTIKEDDGALSYVRICSLFADPM